MIEVGIDIFNIFFDLGKLQIFMFIFVMVLFGIFRVKGIKKFYLKILVLLSGLIVSVIFYLYVQAMHSVEELDLSIVIAANIIFSLLLNSLSILSMKSIFSKKYYEYILCALWFFFVSLSNWNISVAIVLLVVLTVVVQIYNGRKRIDYK